MKDFAAKALEREKKYVERAMLSELPAKPPSIFAITPGSADYAIWKCGSNFKVHLPAI